MLLKRMAKMVLGSRMPEEFRVARERALVEIVSVERLAPAFFGRVRFALEQPIAGARVAAHGIRFEGWALGLDQPVKELSVCFRGHEETDMEVCRIVVDMPRPEIQARYPRAMKPSGVGCVGGGFRGMVTFLGNGTTDRYRVLAVLADDTRVPLWELTVRQGKVGEGAGGIQPILLSSLGRSGSTWLMNLLCGHPGVVAFDPHEWEARVATYWGSVFAAMGKSERLLQALSPADFANRYWWFHDHVSPGVLLPRGEMLEQVTGAWVDAMADVARANIGGFYQAAAARAGKPAAKYFVEKGAFRLERIVVRKLYPAAREIVLVRDLRDMVCSVLAFNRKRGFASFGREAVASDVDYVRSLRGDALRLANLVLDPDLPPIVVKYENLVSRPEETLGRLLEALELNRSDAVVGGMIAGANRELFSHHATSQSPAASIGRWKSDLTPEVQAAFREHLDGVLVDLGYEPTE